MAPSCVDSQIDRFDEFSPELLPPGDTTTQQAEPSSCSNLLASAKTHLEH